jgi:ABC-2 type transport system permease protein
LTKIDDATAAATRAAEDTRKKLQDEFDEARKKEDKALEDSVAQLKKEFEKENLDAIEALTRTGMVQKTGQQRIKAKMEESERNKDREINAIQTKLNLEVRHVQNRYKFWAVALPPILPLVVAVVVILLRRKQEHEGVSRSRLR